MKAASTMGTDHHRRWPPESERTPSSTRAPGVSKDTPSPDGVHEQTGPHEKPSAMTANHGISG